MCDIDFFKKINDSFGHSIGDLLLIEIVKTLLKNLRKTDLAFRYGGEEFLVLILYDLKSSICHADEALYTAKKEGDRKSVV